MDEHQIILKLFFPIVDGQTEKFTLQQKERIKKRRPKSGSAIRMKIGGSKEQRKHRNYTTTVHSFKIH